MEFVSNNQKETEVTESRNYFTEKLQSYVGGGMNRISSQCRALGKEMTLDLLKRTSS
jgi:hypothetical protein